MKIKIVVLIAALVGILWSINRLKTSGIPGGDELLNPTEIALCSARVSTIANKEENVLIIQEGANWVVKAPSARVLDPLTIEKWLGEHCKFSVDSYSEKYVLPGGQTETVFSFVNGQQTRLVRTEPDTFIYQGQVLKSREMEMALRNLWGDGQKVTQILAYP